MDYTLITEAVSNASKDAQISAQTHYVVSHGLNIEVTNKRPINPKAILEVCRPIPRK